VEIETVGTGSDPNTVVRKAIDRLHALQRIAKRTGDSSDKNFEVWIVIDVDTHHHLDRAIEAAENCDIGVALSNPCFEIFLIYHFEDWHAPLSARDACRRLADHIPGYGMGSGKGIAQHLYGATHEIQCKAVHEACKRSEKSIKSRIDEGDPGGSPSSSCHKLVRKLIP
jgi:hypothetical protein